MAFCQLINDLRAAKISEATPTCYLTLLTWSHAMFIGAPEVRSPTSPHLLKLFPLQTSSTRLLILLPISNGRHVEAPTRPEEDAEVEVFSCLFTERRTTSSLPNVASPPCPMPQLA